MADSPKEGEAAQALFCAIADILGSAKVEKSNSKVTGQVFQIMAGSCNDEEFGIDTNL